MEEVKQAVSRLCGMGFGALAKFDEYKASEAYEKDWETLLAWHKREREDAHITNEVRNAFLRLHRIGHTSGEEFEAYRQSPKRFRDWLLVRAWETVL